MIQLIRMAFRDLGRNRRRSFFSSLAVSIGLAMLLLLAATVKGEMSGAMDSTIKLQSGHLQIRASNYDEGKTSLKWEDLITDPEQVSNKIADLAPVQLATPRLFASGILAVGDESAGVRLLGIDPLSAANDPYRAGLYSGSFLSPDDREGILIGKTLAEKLNLNAGDTVNLSVNTSNGEVDEQAFIIRGIYNTETAGFDGVTIFMPLAKAQTITQTEKHASTIFVLLKDKAQTQAVADSLQSPSLQVLTWMKMNELGVQAEALANSYMIFLYLIVLGITATVIVNTLIMAVFERTREIGILMAIGMKSHRIMAMFLSESALLAVGGIIMGLVIGLLVVFYFSQVGFHIGNIGYSSGFLIGNTIYPLFDLNDIVNLTILTFIITLLAGLYPAWMASRLEPVQALHGGK